MAQAASSDSTNVVRLPVCFITPEERERAARENNSAFRSLPMTPELLLLGTIYAHLPSDNQQEIATTIRATLASRPLHPATQGAMGVVTAFSNPVVRI